jgi:hypothetical protein
MTYDREQAWRDAIRHYRAGMKGSMLAYYRCRAKGCLLLAIWQTPKGLEFFAPAARISDRFTSAGQWHWLGFNREGEKKTGDRAGSLDEVSASLQAGGWLWLLCEHVKESMWVSDIRRDAANRRPGQPAEIFLPQTTRPGQP